MENLTEAFKNFSLKETSVGNFILNECNLTVKRATFNLWQETRKTPQLDKEMGRNYGYELSTKLRLRGRSWLQLN